MSSIHSSIAQIASRSKYLLVVVDVSGVTQTGIDTAIAAGNYLSLDDQYVIDTTNASNFYAAALNAGSTTAVAGGLLRDMGKDIWLEQAGVVIAHLRLVQPVNGPFSEGVPAASGSPATYANSNFYVVCWSADPANYPVGVARTA